MGQGRGQGKSLWGQDKRQSLKWMGCLQIGYLFVFGFIYLFIFIYRQRKATLSPLPGTFCPYAQRAEIGKWANKDLDSLFPDVEDFPVFKYSLQLCHQICQFVSPPVLFTKR